MDKINDFRNSIALGFYDGFPKSSNMRLMVCKKIQRIGCGLIKCITQFGD